MFPAFAKKCEPYQIIQKDSINNQRNRKYLKHSETVAPSSIMRKLVSHPNVAQDLPGKSLQIASCKRGTQILEWGNMCRPGVMDRQLLPLESLHEANRAPWISTQKCETENYASCTVSQTYDTRLQTHNRPALFCIMATHGNTRTE